MHLQAYPMQLWTYLVHLHGPSGCILRTPVHVQDIIFLGGTLEISCDLWRYQGSSGRFSRSILCAPGGILSATLLEVSRAHAEVSGAPPTMFDISQGVLGPSDEPSGHGHLGQSGGSILGTSKSIALISCAQPKASCAPRELLRACLEVSWAPLGVSCAPLDVSCALCFWKYSVHLGGGARRMSYLHRKYLAHLWEYLVHLWKYGSITCISGGIPCTSGHMEVSCAPLGLEVWSFLVGFGFGG